LIFIDVKGLQELHDCTFSKEWFGRGQLKPHPTILAGNSLECLEFVKATIDITRGKRQLSTLDLVGCLFPVLGEQQPPHGKLPCRKEASHLQRSVNLLEEQQSASHKRSHS
jgi:hypothetical protein